VVAEPPGRVNTTFTPVGAIPVGRLLADKKSPSLQRGWSELDEFAHWETW
jgi:hypothetical protein